MSNPNIKSTHKPIKTYYAELKEYERLGEQNEGTVRAAFQGLLQHYCHQSNLTLLCEKTHYTPEKKRGTPDGEIVDTFKRSGIVNDPNRPDDPQYIVKLIGQVITGSLQTVDIVEGLPSLDLKTSAQG